MAEKWRVEGGGMDEDMPDVELEELEVKEKVLTLLASFKSNSYRVNISAGADGGPRFRVCAR